VLVPEVVAGVAAGVSVVDDAVFEAVLVEVPDLVSAPPQAANAAIAKIAKTFFIWIGFNC
jgi:hypothetical protein